MTRKAWARLALAVVAIPCVLYCADKCLTKAILRSWTITTKRTLAVSPSGSHAVVEEYVDHGVLGGYRHLQLEGDGLQSVPIASSEWSFEFAATWLDDTHVEIEATQGGAADVLSCSPEPYVLGGKEITVVLRPTKGVEIRRPERRPTK